MVMSEATALRQDIRPLQIALLNLMPNKVRTETQFARLIGATPLQIELTLIRMSEHVPKNTAAEHMEAFYRPFAALGARRFDGLVITGAPIELLPFEEVTYWDRADRGLRLEPDQRPVDLRRLLGRPGDAAPLPRRARSTRWPGRRSAASGTGTGRRPRPICAASRTNSPSRSAAGPRSARPRCRRDRGLTVLMSADETGPCLIEDPGHRALYMFNHIEYDTTSLKEEYDRDVARGEPIEIRVNYFPERRSDAPAREPLAQPRASAARQLDQRGLPEDAVRARRGRQRRIAPPSGRFAGAPRSSGLELGVPVEKVHPAVVQVVRRELAPLVLQLGRGRPLRQPVQRHAGLADRQVALAQVAAAAGGDDVLPGRPPAARRAA